MQDPPETIKGLRVWNSKKNEDTFWCPELGDIAEPPGWEFVPSGNAFVTRTLKKIGLYWILLRRRKQYTYTVGILCPAESVIQARKLEGESRSKREESREKAKKYTEKKELEYQENLEKLMIEYLNFSKRYAKLALKICSQATKHATIVGSERVGRTKQMSLEDRAILAVRAHIRHNYTSYEV